MPDGRLHARVGSVRRRTARHRLVRHAAADRAVRHPLHRWRETGVRCAYRTDGRLGPAQQRADAGPPGGGRVGPERAQDVDLQRGDRRLRGRVRAHARRRAARDHGIHRGTALQGHRVPGNQGPAPAVALRDRLRQLRSAGGERARQGRRRVRRGADVAGRRAHPLCRQLHRHGPGGIGHGLRMGQAAAGAGRRAGRQAGDPVDDRGLRDRAAGSAAAHLRGGRERGRGRPRESGRVRLQAPRHRDRLARRRPRDPDVRRHGSRARDAAGTLVPGTAAQADRRGPSEVHRVVVARDKLRNTDGGSYFG